MRLARYETQAKADRYDAEGFSLRLQAFINQHKGYLPRARAEAWKKHYGASTREKEEEWKKIALMIEAMS